MVKGPIMLEMGIIPQVAVVTSAFMIVSFRLMRCAADECCSYSLLLLPQFSF